MRKLTVAYTIDVNYQVPFCCSLLSLLETNSERIDRVILLHDKTSADSGTMCLIRDFIGKRFGDLLNEVLVDSSPFEGLRADLHITTVTYYRFFLAKYLSDDLNELLFLDPDTIVTGVLEDIYSLQFDDDSDYYFYAVDQGYDEEELRRFESISPGLDSYFNAGVMYINLQRWRDENVGEPLLKIAKEHKEHLLFWDQDALNIFFRDQWGQLPYTYNATRIRTRLLSTPLIVHYAGSGKPWFYLNRHPYKAEYLAVQSRSPFRELKPVDYTPLNVLKKHFYYPLKRWWRSRLAGSW